MSTAHQFWHLTMHECPVKIARLDPGSAVPQWARSGHPLTSVTWNAKETSVIAAADEVPIGVVQAGPFHAFEIEGPLDFTLTGVLGGLLAPLAREGIAVITLSTFETDWILIPVDQSDQAATVWRYNGHTVDTDPQVRTAPPNDVLLEHPDVEGEV
ncbi:ACT domain-containing protein [Austwickia chelonae]|uniref:ACT domain-containing protein n=1 Tax=Austwickia chelonae TaxID=100225 RepID=UPI001F073749|nr:ACT domain-containing protein [Austwickia chelonae]